VLPSRRTSRNRQVDAVLLFKSNDQPTIIINVVMHCLPVRASIVAFRCCSDFRHHHVPRQYMICAYINMRGFLNVYSVNPAEHHRRRRRRAHCFARAKYDAELWLLHRRRVFSALLCCCCRRGECNHCV